MTDADDKRWMARALELADEGRFWARPNPHVGCVLVRDGQLVAEGFTQPAGEAHAEAVALAIAGERARGATAYVTLEPCSHHGRTPPCADALIVAGVARVVVAVEDPHPRVCGQGLARLRDAGVQVDMGLMADAVEDQLGGFLARQRRGRGRLRIKMAASLDGRTAMASGESQWITGEAARRDVQRLRAESCAVVTGIGTVLADDCALTLREEALEGFLLPPMERRALRVVLDSKLRTPPTARVLQGPQPALLVHAPDAAVPEALGAISTRAVEGDSSGLSLPALLGALAERECNEILLESGPALAGAMLRSGLADELVLYTAPKLLGSRGRPMFELELERLAEAVSLEFIDTQRVGDDLRLRCRISGAT
ncbi:MAG: bifunctional diaminohydroxyphosphoribosylaminopyrimidine deaminase/5-amino-6-(5-phosphoribosylamino)uracil reductase RibD [Halieaceae bacterium]|nr:bifunctional diaminohydroxyphosphoribosylaminopyrimidine deaminase/5-amino-6-(5-phosphoribosylamino)uracil reductase RibD [Halieaceae bacterium]